jgi:anti-sigma B factor antagonist
MPLEVTERTVDGVVILDLDGRLVMGDEASQVRTRFAQAASSDDKNLLVNLQDVAYIDSTGLGMLIVGHSAMREVGGFMKLLHLSKRHLQLMVISKLTTVFEIFDDEQQAINSFYSDREVRRFDILEFVKSQEGEKSPLGTDNPDESNSGG